jgi:hypothetical protein
MLDLNTRFELFGVTLYRDADDPKVFFHLPVNPAIPRDSAGLMFDLFAYEKAATGEGADIEAGGFLTLAIGCGLGRLEASVLAELKKKFGSGVRLASVPFIGGSVRLAGLDTGVAPVTEEGAGAASDRGPTGIRLVEKVFGTATPNFDGDNRAVFSLTLTEEGTAFFLDVLENGTAARPLIAIYDLQYVGLMEVESLKIEIDFSRVYDFLRTRIGFNAVVVAGEIDSIVEELRDNQAIKIDDTVRTLELSTPEAMRERQVRIDALVKELATGTFFAPSLALGDPAVDESSVFAPPAADVGSGLFRAGVPAAVGQAMARTVLAREQATATDVNTPPPEPGETAAAAQPPAATGTDVTANSRALGTPRATFTMRRLQQRELRRVTYDMSRTTAIQRSTGPQNPLLFMANPLEMRQRIHKVNLDNPFFRRLHINVDGGGTDFAAEGVREMTVNLRYGKRPDGQPKQTADVVLRSGSDRASFVFARDSAQASHYEFQVTVNYQPDFGLGDRRTSITGPWKQSEATTLAVSPALVSLRQPVTLSLPRTVPPDLGEVRVTVIYEDAERLIDDRRSLVLLPGGGDKLVNLRFADDRDRVRIRSAAVFTDGRIVDLPDQLRPDPAGAPMNAVVLPVPERPAARFSLMLSDPLDEIRRVDVDYEVRQGGALLAANSVELAEALVSVRVAVPLPTAVPPPQVKLRERRIFDSGGIETLDARIITDPSVIVGIPAAQIMEVVVRYLAPPFDVINALGLAVALSYQSSDDDPAFRQQTSLFFEGASSQRWIVRLKRTDERSFTHASTLLLADGTDRAGPAVTTNNPMVVLRIPK